MSRLRKAKKYNGREIARFLFICMNNNRRLENYIQHLQSKLAKYRIMRLQFYVSHQKLGEK